jgi:hypothetical protein
MKVWLRPWDALLDWLDQLRWDWEMRRRFHRRPTRRPVDLSDKHPRWYGWPSEL